MNFFANQNEPVRLFYDMPDYKENRGVQAEISREGTEDDGSVVIKTINLTISSTITGRYEAFYTPTTTEPRLLVRFVIYTNTSYTTKFIGFAPFSAQINLNAGLGGGFGAGSNEDGIKFDLNETELNKIAEMVWKTKLEDITGADTASVWLKTRSGLSAKDILEIIKDFLNEKMLNLTKAGIDSLNRLKGIDVSLKDVNKQIQGNGSLTADAERSITAIIDKGTAELNTKIDSTIEKISSFEQKIEIKIEKDSLIGSIHLLQSMAMFDKKIDHFIVNQKAPGMNDFSGFLEVVENKNKVLNTEQSNFIADFLKDKILVMVMEIENETTKKIISQLNNTINQNSNNEFVEFGNVKTMIANLQIKATENEKKLKEIEIKNDSKKKEIILTVQNNATALGKLIQSKDTKGILKKLIEEIANFKDND